MPHPKTAVFTFEQCLCDAVPGPLATTSGAEVDSVQTELIASCKPKGIFLYCGF